MSWPDLVNGMFEMTGGLLICLSIRRLHVDRVVRGVSAWPVAFFAAWGLWNLFYYPILGQWFSLAGGVLITVANVAWIAQMLYHLSREKLVTCPHGYENRDECLVCQHWRYE